MSLKVVALGAGVHQGEAADAEAVLARVVGRGRQAEDVDVEHAGQPSLVDPRGLVDVPVVGPRPETMKDSLSTAMSDPTPYVVITWARRTVPRRGRLWAGAAARRSGDGGRGAGSSGRLHEQGGLGVDVAQAPQGGPRLGVSDSSSYAFRSEGVRLPAYGLVEQAAVVLGLLAPPVDELVEGMRPRARISSLFDRFHAVQEHGLDDRLRSMSFVRNSTSPAPSLGRAAGIRMRARATTTACRPRSRARAENGVTLVDSTWR